VLLQILDDGRLTDSQGRVVDFKNTVLIMTSNLGSSLIQSAMEGGKDLDEKARDKVMEALRAHFRPEFLNRIDEVVIFESLRREEIGKIVDIQLGRLRKLLADRHLSLELTSAAKQLLGERGYDPVYGARPLKRALQRYLQDPLAKKVLAGEFPAGAQIQIEASQGELTFKKALPN
jgi:ATP-dependent Clp protease ATP-binding subunit ClpB